MDFEKLQPEEKKTFLHELNAEIHPSVEDVFVEITTGIFPADARLLIITDNLQKYC